MQHMDTGARIPNLAHDAPDKQKTAAGIAPGRGVWLLLGWASD
jgi:hypothetical protein